MSCISKIHSLFFMVLIVGKSVNAEVNLKFPKKFLIGIATSAYQVEGAWDTDGKTENIWDYSIHNYPEEIADNSTADVTADMYHKYEEDVELVKEIGFDTFRFSISWARILPNGYNDYVNPRGVDYYHSILDELEKRGITPIVTIYHWDHPENLEEFGGWLSEEMAFVYADYARVIFREFGKRVKFFVTINEPYVFCTNLYKTQQVKTTPPFVTIDYTDWGFYHCIHNMLKGHALAYHIYDKEFREQQKGKVSLVAPCDHAFNKNDGDHTSAEISFEFQCGLVLNPIFSKKGDYPEIVKKKVAERSKLQGYTRSRLPSFGKKWIKYIRGTADYLGLNHYTTKLVEPLPYSHILDWPNDSGLNYTSDPSWPPTQNPIFQVVPEGFGDLLRLLKNKYGNPPIYVLENGAADSNGLDDDVRINYLYSYMKEMLIAIKRDGCNVKAYGIWSFLDSFEWTSGYTLQYGIVQVDYNDPNRERTPKKSVTWLKAVLNSRKLISPDSIDYDYIE